MEELTKKQSTKIVVSLIGQTEIDELLKELELTPNKSFDKYLIAYVGFSWDKRADEKR